MTTDDSGGDRFLSELIRHSCDGNIDDLRQLLTDYQDKDNNNINSKNEYGSTALHYACQVGNDSIVELLIESGANCNIVDENGWTALHWACRNDHCPVAALLLAKGGADIHAITPDGWTALHWASASGSASLVQLLLEREGGKLLLSAKNESGFSALTIAANNNYMHIVEQLLTAMSNTSK